MIQVVRTDTKTAGEGVGSRAMGHSTIPPRMITIVVRWTPSPFVTITRGASMLKVMAFLVKKQGLDTADLIEHYETHHVPLILSLAPAPTTYKRNYLRRDTPATGPDDFDIVTELVFPDRATYQDWVSTMYAAGSGVADDEMNFLDRTRTRSYVVEEHVTDDHR
jgi:EthD domain